ncbi:unnamed protein product, partial [Rotaria magnacalcarata]
MHNTDENLGTNRGQINCLYYYSTNYLDYTENIEYCPGITINDQSQLRDFVNTRDRNFTFDEDINDNAGRNEDLDEEDWLSQLCLFIWRVLFDLNEYATKQVRRETNLSNQSSCRRMTSR